MTPEQLTQILADFPNNGKRHHHQLIRDLAQQCLKSGFEATMLKAQVDGIAEAEHRAPKAQLDACELAS